MTSPVNKLPITENRSPASSSFKTPSPSPPPSSEAPIENATDLQSRVDSEELRLLSAFVDMASHERFQLPELTRDNFLDWEGKITSVLRSKGLYDLVLDKEEKRRDEKGQFVAKDKDPIRLERLNHAHAIMYTRIHSSLTGRLSQNEGKTCPIALWSNIQAFGASKKKANAFKAWVKLNGLVLRVDNIPQFTTDYWNCIATLQSYDAVIEPVSLGHSLLAKLPPGLSHIRDSLISTGSTSEVEVMYETVLDMLDSQLLSSPPIAKSITASPLPKFDSGEATALLTKRCPEGRHLPSASHPAEKCFSLRPDLLAQYQKHLKAKLEAEAHLTTLLGPSMFNVEVDRSSSSSIDKLTETFNQLPGNLVSNDADGYESEVSLI
ncbi:hypothetical protein MJO28_004804 [Puccinia striiformis f. sp. tritici]|uniref:Uncharacterized protein n=1 Tax=Puccinia striiformis f. sp. tritici TaxID=168172 RepID=A0ACC0EIX0_9BASI|nr:hypothetical protein MJO28_004804 [Puccinia striiformis f. sp. tritici]